MFYAGDEPGDVPRFTVFVLPKRFEMDCAKDPEEQKAEAKKECTDLVSHLELFGSAMYHSRPENLKKSNPKKLVKSNKSIS